MQLTIKKTDRADFVYLMLGGKFAGQASKTGKGAEAKAEAVINAVAAEAEVEKLKTDIATSFELQDSKAVTLIVPKQG